MKEKKHGAFKYFLLLFLPGAFLLVFFASRDQGFAEWYATHIYKTVSLGFDWASSLLPFSLAEVLLLLFALWAVIYIVKAVIQLIRAKGKRLRVLWRAVINPVLLGSILLFVFVANAGVNYYRMPFEQAIGLEVTKSSVQELKALCYTLAEDATQLRTQLQEDENGIMRLSQSDSATAQRAKEAYDKMQERYPTLTAGYGPTKQLWLSQYLSYTKITGFFFPFTVEANVNNDVPDYSIPSTMCHELSHVRGYMREEEANFIAYLVCMSSGDQELMYSGTMLAFVHAGNALSGVSRADYTDVFRTLGEGVQRDIKANSEYWAQFEGPVAQAASTMNDTYLKANGQQDGVKSYGKVTDLLLSYYKQQTQ
ncbi:MAG: DUF3810 domain-containing protein [Acutalibacteraceae bacterium]|nr:DUF3810 domain-containing protein [Acutalibacteraceae bacterium]HIR04318.1 DUF3810 domain-containing protein [Candidatus Scatovicinus merdipullorum]